MSISAKRVAAHAVVLVGALVISACHSQCVRQWSDSEVASQSPTEEPRPRAPGTANLAGAAIAGEFYGNVWVSAHPEGDIRLGIDARGHYLLERDFSNGVGPQVRGKGMILYKSANNLWAVQPDPESEEWFSVINYTVGHLFIQVRNARDILLEKIELRRLSGPDFLLRYVVLWNAGPVKDREYVALRRMSEALRLDGIPAVMEVDLLRAVLVPESDLERAKRQLSRIDEFMHD